MAEVTQDAGKGRRKPGKLKVSVVQFRSTRDLQDNVTRHCDYIAGCARAGSKVVVFPECSVTGYFDEPIGKATPDELRSAEEALGAAAKAANAYAIVGIPTKTGAITYNSAAVITPEGKIIERYHKVQLAGERWATPGDHMSVFPVADALCSIIICHDERYPELVRLPVIAGARLVFYISSESGITAESKMVPYRAQIMARAVENNVFIAHANAPQDPKTLEGSHGQSRIIGPDGNIICEGSIFGEEVLTAELDMKQASGGWALQSLNCPFLKDWWEAGAAKVKRVTP